MGEKLSQGLLQVNIPVLVIGFQIFEKIRKHVRISFIQNSVCLLEHEMKISLRVGKQFSEEL